MIIQQILICLYILGCRMEQYFAYQYDLILPQPQQNNMNKTLRTSSLPHLKSPLETNYQRLTRPLSKIENIEAKQQLFKVGEYLIDKNNLLGRGFCSQVYQGYHSQTRANVAVKLIRFDKVKGKIEKRLLKNEIKNWNQIKGQRNILKLYDIVTTKQYVAFISELCNDNLLEILRPKKAYKKQALGKEKALKIIKEILFGYSVMKKHNILHRDIKPANILINQNGQACIADFGFSIKNDEVQNDSHVNIGSPLYMAPQVLKGNNYSSKADIWAIGLIFLQMLIGDLPWVHVKESNLYDKLKEIDMKDIIPVDLQEKYQQCLRKCLQFDPRLRIGVQQMMNYFFDKTQIIEIQNLPSIISISKNQENINEKPPKNEQEQQNHCSIRNLYKVHRQSIIISNKTSYKHSAQKVSLSSKDQRKTSRNKQFLRENEVLALKLRVKPSSSQEVLQGSMNSIHFCKFIFKIIELIIKGKDNIHCNYLEMNQLIQVKLAETILYTLSQIRSKCELKNNFEGLKRFKQTKQIIQLANQYQNSYNQLFEIQFNRQIVAHETNPEYLGQLMDIILRKGKQHLLLILQQVEKLKLNVVYDHSITHFTYLLAYINKLASLIKLKKKDRQLYIKNYKIQDLSNMNNFQSITLSEMRKIYLKIET